MLVGPSRLGKTQWARSLGTHAYIANMWDLSAFDRLPESFWQHGYVVFDDIDWTTIKTSAKSWFGAQQDFTVCDKYRQKKRIKGGIPCIYCCNHDALTDDFIQFLRGDWGRWNIKEVTISNPLFQTDPNPNPETLTDPNPLPNTNPNPNPNPNLLPNNDRPVYWGGYKP